MLVGSDEQNYKAVEAAIGRKVDIIRAYDRIGSNSSRLTGYAAAGYIVHASKKLCLVNGTPVAAKSIPTHAQDADLDSWNAVMDGLKANPNGPHIKIVEHEEDAKTAAGSGVPTDLNAAIDYFIVRHPDTAACINGVCWTGYDLLNREPLYRAAGAKATTHLIDPYELVATGNWAPFIASYGQDLNYLSKIYPDAPIYLGEINAPNTNGVGAQAAWLNQARADLEASYPLVKGASLWQGGNLSETPSELARMKTGFFAPAKPAMAQVDPAKLAQLKALAAAL